MSYENSMPIRFRAEDYGVSVDNANIRTGYIPGAAPEDCALLWLDPDVWPVSIDAQIIVRNKNYSWVIAPAGSSSYPDVTHTLSASARTVTVNCPVKNTILNGSTYTLPVSNEIYGIGPNGRTITAGTVSSGTGPQGWPNNYYTSSLGSDVVASGLTFSATVGDHRTVCTDVSLTLKWGLKTALADDYELYFSFLRNAPAIADVTGVWRAWTVTLRAEFVYSGSWEHFLFAGGVWASTGTGTYTSSRAYVARYRRTLTLAALNSIDPTGAFNWLDSISGLDTVFDMKRNDIFSVTGRTF